MPHYWKKGKDYYISRRSICENCGWEICLDRNGKEECSKFQPKEGFVFVECDTCKRLYEIHETRKQDRADLCPECDVKDSEERQRKLNGVGIKAGKVKRRKK